MALSSEIVHGNDLSVLPRVLGLAGDTNSVEAHTGFRQGTCLE